MKIFYYFIIFFFLFLISFSTKEESTKINFPNLELTQYTNIVQLIFQCLNYSEIQQVFNCVKKSPSINSSILMKFVCTSQKKCITNLGSPFNDKKISISLSKLENILCLTSKFKFQKLVFNDLHTEYLLSLNENKNTEFLPQDEFQKIKIRIFPFLISHVLFLKIKNTINCFILLKDGGCHIRGNLFTNAFNKGWATKVTVTKLCQYFQDFGIRYPIVNARKNIQAIFFSSNMRNGNLIFQTFYKDSEFDHLQFFFKIDRKGKVSAGIYAIISYGPGIVQKHIDEKHYVFDENIGKVYICSHFFNKDCRFLRESEIYYSNFSKEQFDNL